MAEQVQDTIGSATTSRTRRSFLSRNSGANARKTVTFGDGSSVTGNVIASIVTVIVLVILWYLATRRWGMPAGWLDNAEAAYLADVPGGRFTAARIQVACDQDPSCSYSQLLSHRSLPSPADVVTATGELITDGWRFTTLQRNTWVSLRRVLIGLIGGIVIGVPVGLAMGLTNLWRGVFDPIVEGFRPIPPLAFVPLLILWFGIGELSKVLLLFFAALWIMIIGSRSGVLGVKLSKVHAAYSLGASKGQILRNVILPNALPDILTAARVSLGICWGTLVAAEIVGSSEGLGFMIWDAQKKLRMDVVVVGIVVIGVIGVLLDLLMRKVEDRLIPWRGKG